MSATTNTSGAPAKKTGPPGGGYEALTRGATVIYLSLIVLIPLAAVIWTSAASGAGEFLRAIANPEAIAALKVTFMASLIVTVINVVIGTLIAWVLVRDSFWGKGLVNSIIDLPFALPTIVAGLTLLALYGPKSPLGLNVAYTQVAIVMALLFVTLPFVVRAVQPVLEEMDREMEEAAHSLGASLSTTFRRVILPNLMPAILSGAALSFARSVGEFGSLVLISGNLPYKTEVASVYIYGQIQTDNVTGAAAVSVLLLVLSLLILLAIGALNRWGRQHDS